MSALRDPQGCQAAVDPVLVRILQAAAAELQGGWQLELQPSAGIVANVRLVDHRGWHLPCAVRRRLGPTYDAYRVLAGLVAAAQRAIAPELTPWLAWGGRRQGVDLKWQIGRFDLAGVRGRMHELPLGRGRPRPEATLTL